MIGRYKKISIIYGGSGRNVATKLNERINALHSENFYPSVSAIVAKRVLSSASIFSQIKDAISSSDISIIILTFDDVGQTRVRQNVLVEIGMALMAVDNTDKCIFLTEKYPLPDDFPSDLKGWINANQFDKENIEQVIDDVVQEIVNLLKLKTYKEILSNDKYIFDYENLLSDIPEETYEKKADIQLASILTSWEEGARSFTFASERLMYILERLKFFPDFNNNGQFFLFLNALKQHVKFSEDDFAYASNDFLTQVCNFVNTLITYSELKLRKEVIRCMNDPSADPKAAQEYEYEFLIIAEKLEAFIGKIESGLLKVNWLIRIMAYEYAGLAYMKMVNFRNKFDDEAVKTVNKAIAFYDKMLETAASNGGTSENLWRGYAEYDLTRAYETLYLATDETDYLALIHKYSMQSIVTRREWCRVNAFRGVFTNALSFEYFLVKKHELDLCSRLHDYSQYSKQQLIAATNDLSDELRNYYDSSELGRLYAMKESIDALREKIKLSRSIKL